MKRTTRAVGSAFFGILSSVFYLVFGVLFCAAIIATSTATHVWMHARGDDRSPADTIFVLGAAQYNGVPSKWFAARLDHAAELYRDGVAPTIVTVGGNKIGDAYTEAISGKNYLEDKYGIPDSAIVAIETGTDTLTSAQAFGRQADTYGWSSSVVVSDGNHSLRSTKMVEDQGFDAWSSPTRTGPSLGTRTEQFKTIIRETGGLLFYEVAEKREGGPANPIEGSAEGTTEDASEGAQ